MILDGWGIAPDKEGSAPFKAETPFIDSCYDKYPHCRIKASGLAVGLPEGHMGNSEVGHIHIGAGRVVYQELVKINIAIRNKTLHNHKILIDSLKKAKEEGRTIHFMGLVSDGGIHSHINHLKALCDIAADNKVEDLFIHAFTDGRDTDPESGVGFIEDLQEHLKKTTGKIATVTGRYYAMDRDKRWDRTKVAYDALVHGKGTGATDLIGTMKEKYEQNETDEFIKPVIRMKKNREEPLAVIREKDLVIFFNFRTDRGRQLTEVLTQTDMKDKGMETLDLEFVTFTSYDDTFKGIKVLFQNPDLKETLGEVISRAGRKQIRIAETQKYPHVTYFLSAGREEEFEGEERIMVKSSNVDTYDQKPEMSAYGIRDRIIPKLNEKKADFIALNFANLDMVGHTGVFEAAKEASRAVDECAKKVAEAAMENGYTVIITADHGNAEHMKNEDESPNTAHTANPVPLFMLNGPENIRLNNGKLTDIAPTILKLMNLDIPEKMTGSVLFENKE